VKEEMLYQLYMAAVMNHSKGDSKDYLLQQLSRDKVNRRLWFILLEVVNGYVQKKATKLNGWIIEGMKLLDC
jgi:hypothetical protein